MADTDTVYSIIANLKGVVRVTPLTDEDRKILQERENTYENSQQIKVINSGIQAVLRRDIVAAVLKDTSFRKPPEPTVLLVEEVTENSSAIDNTVTFEGVVYRIVGEEILAGGQTFKEAHLFISSEFVLYTERRSGRENVPAYFLMPPVPFPELEEVKGSLQISEVVSASPSTLSDDLIRDTYKLSHDNQLATILVGFNRVH